MSGLSELSTEKYMRILMGRSDVEDALKKLDDLTNEETWMAIAELVSTTPTVAVDVEQVIRSSFANLIGSDGGCLTSLQETNCGTAFTNGSPHQTRPRIITSRVALIRRERRTGSFEEACSLSGNQRIPYFGYTEYVRSSSPSWPPSCLTSSDYALYL